MLSPPPSRPSTCWPLAAESRPCGLGRSETAAGIPEPCTSPGFHFLFLPGAVCRAGGRKGMRTGLFHQEVKSQEAVYSCIPACHFLAPPLPWGRGPSEGQVPRRGSKTLPSSGPWHSTCSLPRSRRFNCWGSSLLCPRHQGQQLTPARHSVRGCWVSDSVAIGGQGAELCSQHKHWSLLRLYRGVGTY